MNTHSNQKYYRIEPDFFENVYYDDEIKPYISEWIINLRRFKNINIKHFSLLFSKYEEIIFPIKITKVVGHKLTILDNANMKYYLCFSPCSYDDMTKYSIGKRAYPFDREFEYEITKKGNISKRKMYLCRLTEDDTCMGDFFEFSYDPKSKITTAILEQENSNLKITYPSQDELYNEKVLNYLFTLSDSKKSIYDVAPIFLHIANINQIYPLSIKVTKDSQVLSEICLSDGIITKYSYTTTSSEEICLHQVIIPKKIEEFISEHTK